MCLDTLDGKALAATNFFAEPEFTILSLEHGIEWVEALDYDNVADGSFRLLAALTPAILEDLDDDEAKQPD